MAAIYKSAAGERAVQGRYRELLARWPVPHRQLRVPARHGETFVVASGDERAPPLVLLQGSGGNAALWTRDVAAWAAAFRVLAVDVIGEPGLSAPARPPLASEAHAEWLDDVLAALAVPRASFVGVSFGGWLALDYAIRRPDRVGRLVLVNPSGVGAQRMSFVWKAIALMMLGSWGRRRAMLLAVGPRPAQPTAEQRELASFVSLVFKHFRPRLGRLPRFSDAELARLVMPLLLILGARDALLDAHETRRRLEHAAPQLSLRFLVDAGHVVGEQTQPILDFLCERAATATGG